MVSRQWRVTALSLNVDDGSVAECLQLYLPYQMSALNIISACKAQPTPCGIVMCLLWFRTHGAVAM